MCLKIRRVDLELEEKWDGAGELSAHWWQREPQCPTVSSCFVLDLAVTPPATCRVRIVSSLLCR